MSEGNHAQRGHAVLSPSGAHRWMNCTPSARLEEQFPDTTSEAAREGTLAHEIAEAKLLHHFKTSDHRKPWLTKQLNKAKKSDLYQPEMEGYTDEYKDFCRKAALAFDETPYIEVEVKLNLGSYAEGSFGTADCIMIGGNTLHIIDFKYGKGVPVSAEHNEQLMLYALGAVETYRVFYPISQVTMSIVQPRIDNSNSWSTSVEELMAFGETVKEKANAAFKGEGEYQAGDWCRFCRAKAQCRKRADENVKLAFVTSQKPPLLTNDEVGQYLKLGEDVAKWLSDLQDFALAECLAGRDILGFKAVEGRGSRVWTDMDKAFEILQASGIDEAMLYERKPLSLAQTEKLIGKKDFEAAVGEYVEKKPGKPALVPDTDKRPAITNKISAADAFKEA